MDWEHANAANISAFPTGDAEFGNIPLFDGFTSPMMGLGSPVELKVEEDAPQPQYTFPRTSLSVQVPNPQVQQPAPMDDESMSPNNSSDDEAAQPRHGTKRVRRTRVMQHRFTERVRREATNDILEQLKSLTGNNAKKKLDVLRAAAVALRQQAAANEALRQQCAELERQQALQDLAPPSPTSLSVGSTGSTENSSFSMPQNHQQLTDARDQIATMDSKAMAGSLVWNCGIGIVLATVTMQCIAMNEFFRSFSGYSDEDLNLGLTCTQLLKADEIGDIYAVMGLLMADKCRAVHIPAKVILTKSGPIWCNVTLTVSRDDASNKLLIAFISPLAVQTDAPPIAQRAIQVS